ncbi:MAG TPA: hypothetical protein DCY00_08110 [Actinobacteria bacterium]|nr:hypothetical protein [Actinomycetota bacterium]
MDIKKYKIIIISVSSAALVILFFAVFYSVKYFKLQNKSLAAISQEKDRADSYEYLLDNYNLISSNTIFSGYADYKGKENARKFTAFSLYYKDKFYIITAGHSIEFEDISYDNFRIRKQNKDEWIYPELLYYSNDFEGNNDFAIFRHESINKGLYPATDDLIPGFILGNSIIKIYRPDTNAAYGESGSPVINARCRVVGVLIKSTGQYTDIKKVLEAIDRLTK